MHVTQIMDIGMLLDSSPYSSIQDLARQDELDVPELTGHFIEESAVKQVGYLTPEEYARSSHLSKQLRLAK